MFGLGLPEIMVIGLVVIVFFFGGEKVEEIARNLGRFTGEFKKGKEEFESKIHEVRQEVSDIEDLMKEKQPPPSQPPPPPPSRRRRQ